MASFFRFSILFNNSSGIVAGMLVTSLVLSLVSSESLKLPYEDVVLWEGIFLMTLSSVCVLAALVSWILFLMSIFLLVFNFDFRLVIWSEIVFNVTQFIYFQVKIFITCDETTSLSCYSRHTQLCHQGFLCLQLLH